MCLNHGLGGLTGWHGLGILIRLEIPILPQRGEMFVARPFRFHGARHRESFVEVHLLLARNGGVVDQATVGGTDVRMNRSFQSVKKLS